MARIFDFLSPGIDFKEVDESVIPVTTTDDGPIIIGRTRKGPGMQPVKIKNLEDYIKVFGKPVAGGGSSQGDVWRDGPNLNAPTYASYAAQAWLASRNSPVVVVRLLGDQADTATSDTNGIAGWKLSGSIPKNHDAKNNSTAYGLFIIDSGSVGIGSTETFTGINFDAGKYGGTSVGGDIAVLSFFQSTGVPTDMTVDEGLKFCINFDDGVTADSVTRRENGAGSGATGAGADSTGGVVPVITIGLDEGETLTEVMALIETAINLAIDSGDISDILVLNKGESLEITNLSTTNILSIGDKGIDNSFQGDNDYWTLEGNPIGNSYGASVPVAPQAQGTGALAAILYCDSGYMALNGKVAKADGDGETHSKAATLIQSNGAGLGFGLDIYDSSGSKIGGTKKFNFTRNSAKYIRNVLNTNPCLTNKDMTVADNRKTYWLGESYERFLKSKVTTTASGKQYGILLPLHKADESNAAGNWGYQKAKHTPPISGWVIADDEGNDSDVYDARSATKLFRVHSLHSGDEMQKELMIQIENIKVATNPLVYKYGSFTLKVVNQQGRALETFNECNLDPQSPNFLPRKVGDQVFIWDDYAKIYDTDNNWPTISNYIRIEMYSETADNYSETAVPFGFLGPGAPKDFLLLSGSTSARSKAGTSFDGVFAQGSGSVPLANTHGTATGGNFFSSSLADCSMKFEFPRITLRLDGLEGNVSNPVKSVFGIRPKVSTTSTIHDSDFSDYVTGLPSNYDTQLYNPSGDFDYSFAFSLDDIVISPTTNAVTYVSGSRQLGTSYTAASGGVSALIDKKVRQFIMPLFGGRHGMDITELEPFRNSRIKDDGTTDNTNYLRYSVKKALDTVADSEVVPANLLVVPGITETNITNKMMGLAESRQDILSIIDLEGDYVSVYESTESAATRRGSVDSVITNIKQRDISTSYSCCFFPWVQITDKLNNNQRVWIPSSIAGLGAMAQSEAASAAWFAPAGFNRGGLGNLGGPSGPRVVQARSRVDSDERDSLYNEHHINPIATFPNEGVVVFGQKTLLKTTSALNRINVRRLMLYVKSRMSRVAKATLFQPNVEATWNNFRAAASPILADLKARFGVTDWLLKLDNTTTTEAEIDQNIMYAQVYLKPARAIEFIAIDFVITKSGADFV